MNPVAEERLFKTLDRMEERLDGIDGAIRGSVDGRTPGINARLSRVERSLRKRKWKLRTYFVAAGSAIGIAAKHLLGS